MSAGLRCWLGLHAWDYMYTKVTVRGFGERYKAVGYYCIRCGVETER